MGSRSADDSVKVLCTWLAVLAERTAVSCVLPYRHCQRRCQCWVRFATLEAALCDGQIPLRGGSQHCCQCWVHGHIGGSSYEGQIYRRGGSQPNRGSGPSGEQAGQSCCRSPVQPWHGLS